VRPFEQGESIPWRVFNDVATKTILLLCTPILLYDVANNSFMCHAYEMSIRTPIRTVFGSCRQHEEAHCRNIYWMLLILSIVLSNTYDANSECSNTVPRHTPFLPPAELRPALNRRSRRPSAVLNTCATMSPGVPPQLPQKYTATPQHEHYRLEFDRCLCANIVGAGERGGS
jgi:hypothetical protein